METMRTRAARNNAEWCDAVCRSHGLRTRFHGDAWITETRSPPLYPDAVTLVAEPDVASLLARLDDSEGCSIKDSYASLDLTPHGFRVLFAAQWVARAGAIVPAVAGDEPWARVVGGAQLVAWVEAGRDAGIPTDVFRPALLDDPSVRVVARWRAGRITGGAVLNRTGAVTGISNVFGAEALEPGLLDCADAQYPGSTLVGYESGAALAAAQRFGFQTVGPLRVWIKDGAAPGPRLRPSASRR